MMSIEDDSTYFAFIADLPKHKEPEPAAKKDVTLPPEFPRGSMSGSTMSAVTDEHVRRVSKPRLAPKDSRPSLSAFQLTEPHRQSEREIVSPFAMPASSSRPYLIAVVLLLVCVVGILFFLLLT